MQKKRMVRIVIAVVLLAGTLASVNYGMNYAYYKKVMPTLTIGSVEVAQLKDGLYTGNFDAKIVSATVEVTVKKGKIDAIELVKHKYEKGGPAVAIVGKIIKAQSLDVDVISGATNSSKTILKAVENALNSAPQ